MAIQRYEPSTLLQQFNDEINRMFHGQADDVPAVYGGSWRPAIDIHESDEAYLIDAEVPGIDPGDIEITLRNGVLTLSGERNYHYDSAQDKPDDESGNTGHMTRHVERRYGRFVRRFTLPDTADADAVEAHAENGVLQVTVPKKAQSQPRRIEVKSTTSN
ncbi:Hsp20/alpha crystallin family protein [Salinisphaera sp. RV14]|uniref:Hsp20/alpha crystallin family protein n=1 Tax=unclassified Salinisphaera TaxID=2649847 RepID=UPI003F83F3F9